MADDQAWEKCQTKGWNLSHESITSEATVCTVRERLEDNNEFALSVAVQRDPSANFVVEGVEKPLEDDVSADTEFDDDLAVSPSMLAAALGLTPALSDMDEMEDG